MSAWVICTWNLCKLPLQKNRNTNGVGGGLMSFKGATCYVAICCFLLTNVGCSNMLANLRGGKETQSEVAVEQVQQEVTDNVVSTGLSKYIPNCIKNNKKEIAFWTFTTVFTIRTIWEKLHNFRRRHVYAR